MNCDKTIVSFSLSSFKFLLVVCKYNSDILHKVFWTLANWHISVGELTLDVGETTSYVGELDVGEMTRWRNDRYSLKYIVLYFWPICDSLNLL